MRTRRLKIEAIWKELEAEALTSGASGWLTRYARPSSVRQLLVAFEVQSKRRALVLPLSGAQLPPKADWPQCSGLEIFQAKLEKETILGVRLQERTDSEVFSALAEDIASRIAEAQTSDEAVSMLLGRLRKWQKFLAAGILALGPQAVKALFGELTAMQNILIPNVGPQAGVAAWVGPQRASQDFQLPRTAIEVKTTASKGPQIIRISSERQLDNTGIQNLFLYVLSLDERVTTGAEAAVGESLPELVDSIRETLQSNSVALEHFDDRLLDAGYRTSDAEYYQSRKFAVRDEFVFSVTEGFPRVVEKDLPTGIGDVSYALSLSACAPFAVDGADLVDSLKR